MSYYERISCLKKANEAAPWNTWVGRALIDIEYFAAEHPHGFCVEDWPCAHEDPDEFYYPILREEVFEWLQEHGGEWNVKNLDDGILLVGFKDVSDAIHFKLRWE